MDGAPNSIRLVDVRDSDLDIRISDNGLSLQVVESGIIEDLPPRASRRNSDGGCGRGLLKRRCCGRRRCVVVGAYHASTHQRAKQTKG
jgi:hypothetical protein